MVGSTRLATPDVEINLLSVCVFLALSLVAAFVIYAVLALIRYGARYGFWPLYMPRRPPPPPTPVVAKKETAAASARPLQGRGRRTRQSPDFDERSTAIYKVPPPMCPPPCGGALVTFEGRTSKGRTSFPAGTRLRCTRCDSYTVGSDEDVAAARAADENVFAGMITGGKHERGKNGHESR